MGGHNLVMDVVASTGRKRGRPPATDSAETWRAILDSARRLFGERGYGAVTNKDVANDAGVTTGALYHYVESKLDLYVAVDVDLQERVYGRFVDAVASSSTFAGKLEAVLEAAHSMAAEDETVVRIRAGDVQFDERQVLRGVERLGDGDVVVDPVTRDRKGNVFSENRVLVLNYRRYGDEYHRHDDAIKLVSTSEELEGEAVLIKAAAE